MKNPWLTLSLLFSLSACGAEPFSEDEPDTLDTTASSLTYIPGQYEVDALTKTLQTGGFSASTLNNFVDPRVGVYIVHRPGAFDDVRYTKAVDNDPYTWGNAKNALSTFALTGMTRRAIPTFTCENIFRVTVEDPATGKWVKLTTGLKMFIHRWQPGGVQLMSPVSKVLRDRATYGLVDPTTPAYKTALAQALTFEKNISVKLVVPALIFNKQDPAGNWIPSNPGGADGAPLSLYFGRVNGTWKLLVANIAEYSCEG